MEYDFSAFETKWQKPINRGIGGDIISHALRGGTRAVGLMGRALQVSDIDYEDNEGLLDRLGSKIEKWSEEKMRTSERLRPDVGELKGTDPWFYRKIMEGVESIGPSVTPLAAGAVGTLAGGPLVGAAAGIGTLGTMFGAGTYVEQRRLLDKEAPQLSPEEKHDIALKYAGVEAGGELAADLIFMATGGIGRILAPGAKATLGQSVKQLLSTSPKKFAKDMILKTYPAELLTEAWQEKQESGLDARAGLRDSMSYMESLAEVAIPTAVMTLAFGTGTTGYGMYQRQQILNDLNSENKETRSAAAQKIFNNIKNKDNEVAQAWADTAYKNILLDEPININDKIVENLSTTTQKTGDLRQRADELDNKPGYQTVDNVLEAAKLREEADNVEAKLMPGRPIITEQQEVTPQFPVDQVLDEMAKEEEPAREIVKPVQVVPKERETVQDFLIRNRATGQETSAKIIEKPLETQLGEKPEAKPIRKLEEVSKKVEAEREEIVQPDDKINGVTRRQFGDIVADGNVEEALRHIKDGLDSGKTVIELEGALINEITEQVAKVPKEERKALREKIAPVESAVKSYFAEYAKNGAKQQEVAAEEVAGEKFRGKTWQSIDGEKTVIGQAQGRPEGWLEVKVEGQRFNQYLHSDELEREVEFDTKKLASRKKMDAAVRQEEKEEADKEAKRKDVKGFTDGKSSVAEGWILKILNKTASINGKVGKRKDLISDMVDNGYRIVEETKQEFIADSSGNKKLQDVKTGNRIFQSPDGGFLDQKQLTKTGLDYAEYLSGLSSKEGRQEVIEKKKKIEDVGEKLHGSRKDQAALERIMRQDISDEDIENQPLSKTWPKPKLEDLDNDFKSAFVIAARAEIPNKPRVSYKRAKWLSQVKSLRDVSQMILDSDLDEDTMRENLKGSANISKFIEKVGLYQKIDKSLWYKIKDVSVYPQAYGYYKGQKVVQPYLRVNGKVYEYKDSIEEAIKEIESDLSGRPKQQFRFEIRGTVKGGYYINKKGDTEYRPLKTFTEFSAARAYLNNKENYNALVSEWEKIKARDNITKADIRREENKPRRGEDYRKGENVDAENFRSSFGFRGVEFGNWVQQGKGKKERQWMINNAYDALMDLSNIVNAPPEAMSLNGSLGLGFGSRGRGKASAHYEPDTIVINLTKTKGAGSFAHEWFHALDNYFQLKRGGGKTREKNYVTYRPEPYYVSKKGDGEISAFWFNRLGIQDKENWVKVEGIRPVVEEKFVELVKQLNDSPMATRAARIDKGRGYWSRIIERAARAFENYVIFKMNEAGYENDYLANIKAWEEFGKAGKNIERYPYLKPDEVEPIAKAFNDLFKTIKTRKTEKGTELYAVGKEVVAPEKRSSVVQELTESPIGKVGLDNLLANGLEIISSDQAKPILSREPGNVEGFTVGGKIYLVENNIKKGQAFSVLSHELGVHAKQLGFNNTKQYKRILTMLESRAKDNTAQGKAVRDAMSRIPEDTLEENRSEETLAYLISNSPKIGIVREFIAHVKRFLVNKLGLDPKVLNNLDLQALALATVKREARVKRGEGINEFAQSTKLSVAEAKRKIQGLANFKTWFKGSKVVKANGNPLVVYHGTSDKFNVFKGVGSAGWFAESEKVARIYAEESDESGGEGRIEKVFLKIKNPKLVPFDMNLTMKVSDILHGLGIDRTAKELGVYVKQDDLLDVYEIVHTAGVVRYLAEQGYDGIKAKESGASVWSAFGPTQIKSVFNTGSWDINEPDILKSVSREIPHEIEWKTPWGKAVTIYKNPTPADYQTIRLLFEEESPNAPAGTPKSRSTIDTDGNRYIWLASDSMHEPVESFLHDKYGIDASQSNEERRIMFSVGSPVDGTPETIEDKILGVADKFGLDQELREKLIYNLVDVADPLRRAQEATGKQPDKTDVYTIERLRGKREAAEIKEFDRKQVQPLLDILADADLSVNDLHEYAYAKHVPEANARLRQTNALRYLKNIVKLKTGKDRDALQYKIDEGSAELEREDRQNIFLELLQEQYSGLEAAGKALQKRREELEARTWTDKEIEKGADKRLSDALENAERKHKVLLDQKADWEYRSIRFAGITDEEAGKILDKWKGSAKIEIARKALSNINDKKLNLLLKAGLITPESYKAIKNTYEFYVPLYREGRSGERPGTVGRKTGPLGKEIHARAGSLRPVENVVAHTVDNYQTAIGRKWRSETGKALYDLVSRNPDPDIWWIEDVAKKAGYDRDGNIQMYTDQTEPEDGFFVKINGERKLIRVNPDNTTMMRLVESIKSPSEMGSIVKVLGKVNRYLAAINTSFSPEFMLSNFLRDIQTAGIHMEDTEAKGMQKKIIKDVFPAIKGIWKAEMKKDEKDPFSVLFREFEKEGAKIGWRQGYESVEKLGKNLQREIEFKQGKHVTKKTIRAIGGFIEAANTAVENGVRLAVYKHLSNKVGKQKAAFAAANLTVDFTKKGAIGPNINAFYLFSNAGIQGSVRIMQAGYRSPKVRKIMGGVVAGGFAMNMLGLLMGGDDDDGMPYYEKTVPEFLKERNIIIMIPGSKGKYFQIPMPWGYNAFYNLGHELGRSLTSMMSGRDYSVAEGAARVAVSFANAFNPIASATALQMIMPTVFDPVAMIAENRTWYGGPLMPEKNPFERIETPDSQRYWKSVSTPSKFMAEAINKLTGGDTVKKGLVDISPETIDLWYDTAAGSAGRFVKDTLNVPVKLVSGEEIQAKEWPFARRVFGQPSEYADQTLYYNNVNKVLTLKKQLKVATPEQRKKLLRDKRARLILAADKAEKTLRKLYRTRKKLQASGRKKAVDKINVRIKSVQKEFNKRYNMIEQ